MDNNQPRKLECGLKHGPQITLVSLLRFQPRHVSLTFLLVVGKEELELSILSNFTSNSTEEEQQQPCPPMNEENRPIVTYEPAEVQDIGKIIDRF